MSSSSRKRQKARVVGVHGDVLEEILYRLPLKSLGRFKSVDKEWNSSISNPHFHDSYRTRKLGRGNHHLILAEQNRAAPDFLRMAHHKDVGTKIGFLYTIQTSVLTNDIVNLTPVTIPNHIIYKDIPRISINMLGSYNGLVGVLAMSKKGCDLILSNPLTKKHVTCFYRPISMITNCDKYDMDGGLFGLCYDSSSDAYMAVVVIRYYAMNRRLTVPQRGAPRTNIRLVNFKTGSFTKLSVPELGKLSFKRFSGGVGTVVCGVPHWVERFYFETTIQPKKDILYFDVEDKIFKKMGGPPTELGSGRGKAMIGLGSTDGERRLSVVLQSTTDRSLLEVWVMKEYRNLESWSVLFAIKRGIPTQLLHHVCVLGFLDSGEYLLNLNDLQLWGYDPEKDCARHIRTKQRRSVYTMIANEASLISPPYPTA